MSERASIRGGPSRGSDRGRSSRSRGGHPGAQRGGGHGSGDRSAPPAKKENILDLSKYADKEITVKFNGGREVVGRLKGWDQLMNLVLDGVREVTRDDENNTSTRQLGLLVARGTLLTTIAPVDGSEEIANPFAEDGEGNE
ncbi:MAG: Sm-like protein lsm7 [Chrysothrix sp. TS-e1954]|nr:MAG: Sm-like protein lsm7 [Chrysothrix sp. TS-e1954]